MTLNLLLRYSPIGGGGTSPVDVQDVVFKMVCTVNSDITVMESEIGMEEESLIEVVSSLYMCQPISSNKSTNILLLQLFIPVLFLLEIIIPCVPKAQYSYSTCFNSDLFLCSIYFTSIIIFCSIYFYMVCYTCPLHFNTA